MLKVGKTQNRSSDGLPSYTVLLLILLASLILAGWLAWLLLRQYVVPRQKHTAQSQLLLLRQVPPETTYAIGGLARSASMTGMPSTME
ncbi:MAG: hypothetical protein ACYC46_09315 [Acidobacteriaceae bacterium]